MPPVLGAVAVVVRRRDPERYQRHGSVASPASPCRRRSWTWHSASKALRPKYWPNRLGDVPLTCSFVPSMSLVGQSAPEKTFTEPLARFAAATRVAASRAALSSQSSMFVMLATHPSAPARLDASAFFCTTRRCPSASPWSIENAPSASTTVNIATNSRSTCPRSPRLVELLRLLPGRERRYSMPIVSCRPKPSQPANETPKPAVRTGVAVGTGLFVGTGVFVGADAVAVFATDVAVPGPRP